jgi:hypothetical protein
MEAAILINSLKAIRRILKYGKTEIPCISGMVRFLRIAIALLQITELLNPMISIANVPVIPIRLFLRRLLADLFGLMLPKVCVEEAKPVISLYILPETAAGEYQHCERFLSLFKF